MSDSTLVRLLADKEEALQAHFRRFDEHATSTTRALLAAQAGDAEGIVQLSESALRDSLDRALAAARDARPVAKEVLELRQRLL